ncbi:hypothetical protein C7S18_05810 [Ahniella affigens]|uniref:Uncharacterized protein n=1 Tax=Ahniella affigens TaxID=2021234 RepID=A0A2P1PPG8_9GAMM|nr:hypothetical protein C7S18_05810 [Ahniella affigens]
MWEGLQARTNLAAVQFPFLLEGLQARTSLAASPFAAEAAPTKTTAPNQSCGKFGYRLWEGLQVRTNLATVQFPFLLEGLQA